MVFAPRDLYLPCDKGSNSAPSSQVTFLEMITLLCVEVLLQ